MTENTDTKFDALHNPAVWFSALLLVFPLLLAIDLFFVHPTSYDGNLRTQIVTAILAVIMMVGAYWLGTVASGAQKKPDQPPAPAAPAVPPAVAGFATIPGILLLIVISLAFISVTGCASLTQAGNTGYSIEPVLVDGKATGGCKFNATDGKEYASRSIAMTTAADGCALMVNEGASSAFQGQAIAGKALSVLPSFAAPILAPGPASIVPLPAASAKVPTAAEQQKAWNDAERRPMAGVPFGGLVLEDRMPLIPPQIQPYTFNVQGQKP